CAQLELADVGETRLERVALALAEVRHRRRLRREVGERGEAEQDEQAGADLVRTSLLGHGGCPELGARKPKPKHSTRRTRRTRRKTGLLLRCLVPRLRRLAASPSAASPKKNLLRPSCPSCPSC